MALAGSGIALLAGVAGIISQILFHSPYDSLGYFSLNLAAYIIPTAIAIAALLQINRLIIIGLLQGMWWPAVAFVVTDIVSSSVDHMFGFTGRLLAGYWVGNTSDVLGVGAVILLVISWNSAVGKRRGSRLNQLQVMLLCGVGLSQIAVWIFWVTLLGRAAEYALGVAGLLVGLAVTWYAVKLRDSALGGVIVLGWVTIPTLLLAALTLAASTPPERTIGLIGCALAIAVAWLALSYMQSSGQKVADILGELIGKTDGGSSADIRDENQ